MVTSSSFPSRRFTLVAFVLGLLMVGACGGVGNEGTVVGGPCEDSGDCASGSYCARGGDFPGGTCTVACRDDGDCPGGTACVDKDGGICLLLCHFDEDCRRDYRCKDKSRRGHSGKATVCIDD
jgi:hypothetical protein